MEHLISVIVPIYKVEKYLSKCIDSILIQTYNNLEIILVNDGSPDKCGSICDEYAAKDSRIIVIHKENGGLSDARNVAIDIATGEYLTFIDSDDYVTSDYIETLYQLVKTHNSKISVALPQTFYEGEDCIIVNKKISVTCFDSLEAIEEMFYQKQFDTNAWGKLYHHTLFDTGIRYPKGILFEDLPTTYLLFAETDRISFTNKRIYYYMLRKDSIEGSTFNTKKAESALQIFKLMETHSNLLNKVRKSYECRMLSFSFHLIVKMPDYHECQNILYDKIKEYRRHVLFNNKARIKNRVACLISYLGINLVKRFFSLIDERK